MTDTTRIPVNIIESFIVDVFQALGIPAQDAAIAADVLISSDLRGIDSHGVGRLKYYYDRITAGVHLTTTTITVVNESETTVLLDGGHGLGHAVAHRAMRMAMDKAKRYGMGSAAVRNSTHFGIAGYYPLMAAKEGMMGLTVTNARPAMSPTFGTEPMLGTNPIAFAAPSDMEYPFCFDAATPITQRGKIEVLERAEKLVPEGWVVGVDGLPLSDPTAILENFGNATAALLPLGGAGEEMGGHKGYGLGTLVEILSASLSGGAFQKDLLGFAPDGSRRPYMLGHFFLAIDIERFIPLELSRHITGQIMRNLQGSRKAPGHDRIYVAGEKEYETENDRRQTGIPVNANLRQELQFMRDELSIEGYEAYF
jgi:L-2-hydroxycarboxylate dehydrogenase (NAD+)